jgi:hypothetical protein
VQVLLDPTMVGSHAWIEPLRSILLFSVLFLSKFRSDDPCSVGNFGWDPTISSSSQNLRVFDHSINVVLPSIIRLQSFDLPEIIFCLPVDYKLLVLMPSSLLYLPSMTSIHYLLNISQQSPPLALMATHAPTCIAFGYPLSNSFLPL